MTSESKRKHLLVSKRPSCALHILYSLITLENLYSSLTRIHYEPFGLWHLWEKKNEQRQQTIQAPIFVSLLNKWPQQLVNATMFRPSSGWFMLLFLVGIHRCISRTLILVVIQPVHCKQPLGFTLPMLKPNSELITHI